MEVGSIIKDIIDATVEAAMHVTNTREAVLSTVLGVAQLVPIVCVE